MIRILDTTLREGEQHPNVYFSSDQKLLIARKLDELGVDYIEAGNPAADRGIEEAVRKLAADDLRATIVAHSLCREPDVKLALDTGVGLIGLFLNLSPLRLRSDLDLELTEALHRIESIVTFAKKERPDVAIRFTMEDVMRCPLDALLEAAQTAAQAGADVISLADSTGFANPFVEDRALGKLSRRIRETLTQTGLRPLLAVHCHNDRGLALANALEACREGVDIVDTSVLGLGERSGITDTVSFLVNVVEQYDLIDRWQLDLLPKIYDLVSEYSGVPIPRFHPVTGEHSFTHTSGVHIKAMSKDSTLYQSLDSRVFGRAWNFVLGTQSGSASVRLGLQGIGQDDLAEDPEFVTALLSEVKSASRQGKVVELKENFKQLAQQIVIAQGKWSNYTGSTVYSQGSEDPVEPERGACFESFPLEDIDQTIAQRFEAQVAKHGHRIAVADSEGKLNYEALNNRANQICNQLLKLRGTKSEPIGLLLGHDIDTVAAILAVLKAGKFYFALDPTSPPARLASIIQDTGAALVISTSEFEDLIRSFSGTDLQFLYLNELHPSGPTSSVSTPTAHSDPAYLIYTSGSTGQPKGVIQTHRSALHNVMNYTNGIYICHQDRLSLLASFSFSASISAIFGALLNGASLHLYDVKRLGVEPLARWLEKEQITIYHSVATVFRQLVRSLSGTESFSSCCFVDGCNRYVLQAFGQCLFFSQVMCITANP